MEDSKCYYCSYKRQDIKHVGYQIGQLWFCCNSCWANYSGIDEFEDL